MRTLHYSHYSVHYQVLRFAMSAGATTQSPTDGKYDKKTRNATNHTLVNSSEPAGPQRVYSIELRMCVRKRRQEHSRKKCMQLTLDPSVIKALHVSGVNSDRCNQVSNVKLIHRRRHPCEKIYVQYTSFRLNFNVSLLSSAVLPFPHCNQ